MKKQTPQGGEAPAMSGAAPTHLVEPPEGWPPDEYTGHAGRYVRDPVTGIRRPADDPVPEQAPPAAGQAIAPQPEGNTP